MYFKRKIDHNLDNWIKKKNKSPKLVVGIRQCGKTESIREFARRNKLELIELNFWTNPEYILDFNKINKILLILVCILFPKMKINPTLMNLNYIFSSLDNLLLLDCQLTHLELSF